MDAEGYSKLTPNEAMKLLLSKDEHIRKLSIELEVYKDVIATFAAERSTSKLIESNPNRIIKRKYETIEVSSSDNETDEEVDKKRVITLPEVFLLR